MMTLITGFTCPPTIYFKFTTKCDKCYYKVRQLFFYYKVRWSVITKCDNFFITKCDKCYYKVRQILQSVTILLQSATGITKCDHYYKVRQYNERQEMMTSTITLLNTIYRRDIKSTGTLRHVMITYSTDYSQRFTGLLT